MKKYLVSLAMLASMMPAMAQNDYGDLTIDAQVRTRGEYRNGQGTLRAEDATPATFINDRVRLGIGWERKNLSLKISAQHTGVWGDDKTTNNLNKGNININEAWAKITTKDKEAYMQLGRQFLAFDDERILGGLDWATTGRSHDAIKLGVQTPDGFGTQIFAAYNQNKENTIDNLYDPCNAGYQHMEGLRLSADNKYGSSSLIFLNTGVQNIGERKTYNMQTIGIYSHGKGKIEEEFSAYYQFGRNTSNQKIKAFLLSDNVKYHIDDQWTVGVGDDYISGGSANDSKCRTFNVLYGTHHKFYGTMDYFNNTTMPTQGLNDLYANLAFKKNSKVDFSAAYHYFAVNHKMEVLRGSDVKREKTLGSEVDLQMNWKVQKDVTFQCGYSMMFATKLMAQIKGGNCGSWQDWGWISLNVSPRIFSTKK